MIGEDGRMTEAAGEAFAGHDRRRGPAGGRRRAARAGAIGREEPYTHEVPFSHRSGERIEPLISLQWFMRMDELAAPAIEAVRDGALRFTPERWGRVYLDWLENIRPWCVSRQLWWGHRMPVWYRGEEIHVATVAPEGEGWERDPDVLDTWFSSALWPFATLGWPERDAAAARLLSHRRLVTARDIIFLWVARMVMMGARVPGRACRSPTSTSPRSSRRPTAAGCQVAGHRDRPARRDRDRTAPTPCASACWRCPPRRTCATRPRRSQQGQQLANKLWNASRLILLSADAAAGAQPDAAHRRGPLDPLAPGARPRDGDRAHRGLRLLARRPRSSTTSSTASCATGISSWSSRGSTARTPARARRSRACCTCCATRSRWRTRSSRSSPRRSGLHARARRACSPAAPSRGAGRPRSTMRPRRSSAWRSRRCRRCAAGATGGARPGERRARAARGRGLRRHRRAGARLARFELAADGGGGAVASIAVPGGAVQVLAERRGRSPRRPSAARRQARAKLEAEIARSEGKLSNDGFVAKAPPDRRRGRAREARAPARGARRAVNGMVGRAGRGATCSPSSSSACGSASIACVG